MKKRRIIVLFVMLFSITFIGPSRVNAEDLRPIQVYLQGENFEDLYKEDPIIRENRTYLPIRAIAEKLGFHVDWNGQLKEVKIYNNDADVSMNIGSKDYSVNTIRKTMDAKPFIEKNKTYVPVRFVSQALGVQVEWDGGNRLVVLDYYPKSTSSNGGEDLMKSPLGFVMDISDLEQYNLITKDENVSLAVYNKQNYETGSPFDGYIGHIRRINDPGDIPAPHILLDKSDDDYLVFVFASDVRTDINNPDLVASYQSSRSKVLDLLKTVHFD